MASEWEATRYVAETLDAMLRDRDLVRFALARQLLHKCKALAMEAATIAEDEFSQAIAAFNAGAETGEGRQGAQRR